VIKRDVIDAHKPATAAIPDDLQAMDRDAGTEIAGDDGA
jgi:hypothetical protein